MDEQNTDRRVNDQENMMLIQDMHDRLCSLDIKLDKHMTEETAQIAQEMASLISSAFPNNDPVLHRLTHEAEIQRLKSRSEFWGKLLFELSKYGLIGFVGWLVVSLWRSLLAGPQ